MAKLWAFYLLSLAPFIGADWVDIVKKECSHESKADRFFQEGYVYTYNYHAVGSGAAVGTSDRSSEIALNCSVTVTEAVECFYNLKVSSCKVSAKGGQEGHETPWIKDHDLSIIAKYSVLFSLNNGKLGSIFALPEDPLYSLNIKRGIISGFGISKSSSNGEEEMYRDVQGTCPRTATLHGNHIKSSKHMTFCRHPSRPDWQLSPLSFFWNMTFIQQPLVNSSAECDYTVDDAQNQLHKVSCHERHAIYLDSSQSTANSVQTNVRYLLELKEARKELHSYQHNLNEMRATGIELEYDQTPEPQSQPPNFEKEAEKLLSDLVLVSQDVLELRIVPLFQELLALLRTSSNIIPFIDRVILCSFLEGVSRCNKHQKELALSYLKDAVLQCNTGACMEGFRRLVVRDQLSHLYLTGAFLAFNYIPITNPTYIGEILEMCKHTQMKICWLTLGTAIHKYSEDHYDIPQAVKDTINYLSSYIGEECNVEDVAFPSHYTSHDKQEYLLTVIKTIGNIGDAAKAVETEHEILQQLFICASSEESPQEIAIGAVKAMNRMKGDTVMYKKLLSLLKDHQNSVGIRLSSYDILVKLFPDAELAKEIANVLSTEKSTQVKCYIITDIERIRRESDEKDPESFAYKLLEHFKEASVYLEDFRCSSFQHSSSSGSSYFFNLNFLPEDMKRFGIHLDRKIVFDTLGAFSYSFTRNFTTELFSKLYNVLESGISAKNWEEFAIWMRRQLMDSDVHIGQWLVQNFVEILRKLDIRGLIPLFPGSGEEELNFVYPDQKIADNLKKTIKLIRQSFEKGKPYLEMYLKTFGNEVDYVTLHELFSFLISQYQWLSNQDLEKLLKNGITYNITRAMVLTEAYHYVPTLMGLPLNWSTKVTYILSPRHSVDADFGLGEKTANLYSNYSEAFTVLCSMVLDLPQVTQVGVQANVSMHTSLDYHLKLYVSDSKHLHEISFKPSGKRQKFVEFYRTNQQILHDRYEDIPDWTTDRKDEEWCTSKCFNEIVGYKFCCDASYPALPVDMITSTFMAGWTQSKIYATLDDRSIQEYKLSLVRPPVEKGICDLKLKLIALGEKHKREAMLNLYVDVPKQESNFEIIIPELPDLIIKGTHKRIVKDDGIDIGVNHYWIVQSHKDHRYEIRHHFYEDKMFGSDVRAGHKKENIQDDVSRMCERTIDLHTPYNIYHWESKCHVQTHEHDTKAEVLFTYENLKEDWKWPSGILAKSLWETDKKAWVRFETDCKVHPKTPDILHYVYIVNSLKTPKRSLTIVSHKMEMPGHVKFEVNATAVENESNKLLTFANFSYNNWKNDSEQNKKDLRNVNLKIPHYTWNIRAEKEENEFEQTVTVKLDQSREVVCFEEENEAIGWCDNTLERHVEELTATYKGHIKVDRVDNHLLPQDWRENDYVKNKDQRYKGYNIIGHVAITFPANGKEEAFTIKGNSLHLYNDYSKLPKWPTTITDIRQWLDAEASESLFVFHNTFNNHHREIRTVTGARQGWVKRWISHRDNYAFSDGEEAKYFLNLLWGEKEKCEYVDFSHGFSSSFYSLRGDILLECKPKTTAYQLKLDLKTLSEWDMLNSNTDQIFYLESSTEGWESMNFTHPALDIGCTATMGRNQEGLFYDKEWVVNSRTDIFPSAKIRINYKKTTARYTNISILMPEEGLELSQLQTDIGKDGSKFTSAGYHILTSDPVEEHQHSSFDLRLLTPYKYSVKGHFDLEHLWTVAKWFHHKLELVHQRIEKIRGDVDHPLNKLRRSIQKSIQKEEEYLKNALSKAKRNLKEIRQILYPFFDSTIETVSNIQEKLSAVRECYQAKYRDASLSGYIEQLLIKNHTREIVKNLPYLLMEAAKLYIIEDCDNRIIKFSHTGRHGFYWDSLLHIPQTFEGTLRWPGLCLVSHHTAEVLFRSRYMIPPFYKTAMIFGTHHVYTFDGKMYEFPDFPSPDCTYILLHDVRHQSFSALASAHKIHLLFPEMTVTIGQDEKIHVNNSQQQSEVPLESSNGKVSVRREGTIIIVETIGLIVLCDTSRMFCIFSLEPLHHSGTLGLLGNADGEAFNDFMLPDGKVVKNVAEMARDYEVTNHEKCTDIQEREKPQWSSDHQTRCSDVFPHRFYACASYLEIDENLFKEACHWDAYQDKDVCTSPNALAGYCTFHGKKTEPCSPPQNWDLKAVPSAERLEVILVMDQYSSLFPKGLQGLKSMLGAIENEFRDKNYGSILYSLIGFGGKGIRYHPHIQTPDTAIWHSHKDIVSYMDKTLQFKGQHRGDALEAVKYATAVLPFSMPSSRIMLLFTVNDSDSYLSDLKVKYLQHLLDSYSITLYTFADFPIEKGTKVFGVRADGYIFPQSKEQDSYMDVPKTEKAKLTSGTHGTIFMRQFVEDNEPPTFFETATKEFQAKVHAKIEERNTVEVKK